MPTLAGVSGHSFQSTLPLRGATNVRTVHAVSNRYFNPHSPCGERHMPPFHIGVAELFQSTLPLRGATSPTRWNPRQSNFNPHSPCGERLHRPYRGRRQPISIHTPLAGSDSEWSRMYTLPLLFQSTLPLRGATKVSKPNAIKSLFQSTLPLRGATGAGKRVSEMCDISIHTPLAGSDRAPCGDRVLATAISIHTPLAGSDLVKSAMHDLTS